RAPGASREVAGFEACPRFSTAGVAQITCPSRNATTVVPCDTREEASSMSYLSSYATRNPRVRGAGVDEKIRLNLRGFHGGAYVRVFDGRHDVSQVAAPAAAPTHPPADRRLLERDLALVRAP